MNVKECFLCSSPRLHYLFSLGGIHRVVKCDDCNLVLLNPQPSDEQLAKIYGANYFLAEDTEAARTAMSGLKRGTARWAIDKLVQYSGVRDGEILEIGCGQGDFLAEASASGYKVTGLEYSAHACEAARSKLGPSARVICGEIDRLVSGEFGDETAKYDICAFSDVIEHVRNPRTFLTNVHKLLKPGGIIIVTAPSLNSWSAKLMKQNWMEFKPEHLTYFNDETLQSLLCDEGFKDVVVLPQKKLLSFEYVKNHFDKFPVPFFTAAIRFLNFFVPSVYRKKPVNIVASGVMMMARSAEKNRPKKLSVIMPVYNEAQTIGTTLQKVLAKASDLKGLAMEVIVVESKSTDDTHAVLEQFRNHPLVKLIFQESPKGKGNAVRQGLQSATGDFVLIQDGDMEYDLEDYDALLEPLIRGEAAFVLGARHGGKSWKMRQFEGQPLQSFALNVGHWFFATLVNVLFFTRLKDPFTMYKVFRRDCLFGLSFECDRFDFDFELLIKLVRKGYKPLEIPVNYRSRSFDQGKKVSVFRDPITWIRALVKYRLSRLDTLEAAAQSRIASESSDERNVQLQALSVN